MSTPSRVVTPTLISSDESNDGKEKEQDNYDGGNDLVRSRILRRKKRRAQVEASLRNQTHVLPVVSPTNGDNKGHTNLVDEDASVESFDYPVISIRMKSSATLLLFQLPSIKYLLNEIMNHINLLIRDFNDIVSSNWVWFSREANRILISLSSS